MQWVLWTSLVQVRGYFLRIIRVASSQGLNPHGSHRGGGVGWRESEASGFFMEALRYRKRFSEMGFYSRKENVELIM